MNANEMANAVAVAMYEIEDSNPRWQAEMLNNLPRDADVFTGRVTAAIRLLTYVMNEANYTLIGLDKVAALKMVRRHNPGLGLREAKSIVEKVAAFDENGIIIGEHVIDLRDLAGLV